MAASTAYKLGIVISADASSVKPAAADTKNELASISQSAATTETSMQRLIATAAGLHVGASNSNQRAWAGALADEGLALDKLRSKYNPMFAVISQYKIAQTEIRTAHAMGALSADEMTSALSRQRQATLASIDALKGRNNILREGSVNGQSFAAQNAMFQFQDIGMTAAMGMNPGMIALQQGSQLAGAFSGMSMKQTGASIASAFTMLLSPVSLATVAVTGLAAAAIQYGMNWMSTAKDLNKTINDHEEQIKRLHDAYQYAGTGADAYYQRVNAGDRFGVSQSRKELNRTITDGSNDLINNLGGKRHVLTEAYAGGYFNDDNPWKVHSQFKPFEEAILQFQETIQKGEPDILGFRKAVEDRWNLDPTNDALSDTAKKLLGMGQEATKAATEIERLKEARNRFILQETRRRASEYTAGISGMRGIAALQNTDRRQVEEDYAKANGNAGDRDERADAYRQRSEALARINDEEQRQVELSRVDIQLQVARDPITQAELAAARERIELQRKSVVGTEAEILVKRARDRVMAESFAQNAAEIADLKADLEARRKVNEAVAAGNINAAQAAEFLQLEARLRPMIIAASKTEYEEKQKLLEIIREQTAASQALFEENKRAQALDFIKSQNDRIAGLKVELALTGETESVRNRIMAQFSAEQKIRDLGLAANSNEAEQIREKSRLQEKLTRELEKQADAWATIRDAGESAIDSLVDKLSSGDLSGALEDISKDLTKSLLTLGVTNPLKNGLLGTNYGTINDVGGFGGIISKLFGGGEVDANGIIQSALGASATGTMNVTAATVMVNGSGLSGDITKLLSGANDNLGSNIAKLSGGGGPLSFVGNYKSGVDNRLTDILTTAAKNFPGFKVDAISGFRAGDSRFHGKGLATDVQLTDLLSGKMLGNYQDASSFRTYEQFAQVARQVQMAKYPELVEQFRWGGYFGGGKGKYGALDTMHFDLAGNRAGMSGGSWANGLNAQQMALWSGASSKGMDTASAALERLAGVTSQTTEGLGQFGGGLESLARNFASMGGGGGNILGSLFPGLGGFASKQLSGAIASGSWGLWSDGGYTGPGGIYEPRGVVHAGEVVWSQRDVARAGGPAVVDAMRLGRRGYSGGGVVDGEHVYSAAPYSFMAASPPAPQQQPAQISIHNYAGANVRTEEESDGRGGRRTNIIVEESVGDAISRPGSSARNTLGRSYGMRPKMVKR